MINTNLDALIRELDFCVALHGMLIAVGVVGVDSEMNCE